MLQLILGRAQSGKTYSIMCKIKELLESGRQDIILLVPEQFSFESEKALLSMLGASVSSKVNVAGFTRLCDYIGDELGGKAGRLVDDGSRLILMRQALKGVHEQLTVFSKYADSTEFARQIVETVTEMKQAAISPQMLSDLSIKVTANILKQKLCDISVIMSAYDALLEGKFIDPLDLLQFTGEKLLGKNWFAGKTVLIDSFTGFTSAQYKLIERIIAESEDTYITFCSDGIEDFTDGTGIFSNIKKEIQNCLKIAESHTVKIAKPIILEKINCETQAMLVVEAALSGNDKVGFENADGNIVVCRADTMTDEADFVANTIRNLVRNENYRYRDFVVIARNAEDYEAIMEDAMRRHEIPCFLDSRISIRFLPLTVFITSAIDAAAHFRSDDIFRFLKTGLAGLSFDEISELENYVYIWSINGQKWLEDWTMSPYGLDAVLDEEKSKVQLEHINKLRIKALNPLVSFKNRFKKTASDMVKAIFRLIEDCNASKYLEIYTSELEAKGDFITASAQQQGWDKLMEVFDRLVLCLGENEVNEKLFTEMLNMCVASETVGEIPQRIDEVIFGPAAHIRPMRPKAVFVIGVNQGCFPAVTGNSGLLTVADRARLIALGAQVGDRSLSDIIKEKFLFYTSSCCASQKLYITYHEKDNSSVAVEPSKIIDSITKKIEGCVFVRETKTDSLNIEKIEAIMPAFESMSRHWHEDSAEEQSLKQYFSSQDGFKDRFNAICRSDSGKNTSINRETAKKLFGERMQMSASKIDVFYRCSFSYFCKFGLRAKTLKKAEMDVMTRGTLVHYVLEKIVSAHKTDISSISDDTIQKEVTENLKQYFINLSIDTGTLGPKFNYMLTSINKLLCQMIVRLREEFAQSQFVPEFCELEISETNEIKPLKVPLENGGAVEVSGIVDRVDFAEKDGKKYIRIIDYKTGHRDFAISDTLYGLNLQMLIYLYAIVKCSDAEPGGILYMPAKRVYKDSQQDEASNIKMNGILTNDPEILNMMEEGLSGKYIPAKATKNGFDRYSKVMDSGAFFDVFKYIDRLLKNMGDSILCGKIDINPRDAKDSEACKYCDYNSVCKKEKGVSNELAKRLEIQETIDLIKEKNQELFSGDSGVDHNGI